MKVGMVGIVAGVFVLALSIFSFAQDFPYAAPQAPEFDDSGNAAPEGRAEIVPAEKHGKKAPAQVDYRSVRPYAPEAQQAPGMSGAHMQATAPVPQPRLKPQQPMPAPQPQAQNERPDCTQFPMRIARSQSDPEMQEIAKQYLSCLLRSGWQMEQAKQQVITTIESTYRLVR